MTKVRIRLLLGAGVLVALIIAGLVSYYASSKPDGLQRVATDKGFADQAAKHPQSDSPLAGYGTDGVDNNRLSAGVAGVVGTLGVLVIATGLAYFVRARSRPAAGEPTAAADARAAGADPVARDDGPSG